MLNPRPFPETRPSMLDTMRDEGPGHSAWREFYQYYGPAVFRVAKCQGLDAHDAEDVVQQVMLTVSGHIGKFNYDRDCGRFRHWIKTVTRNKIRDLHRRRSAGVHTVPDAMPDDRADDQPSLDETWEQEWKLQEILHCLEQLTVDFAPKRVEAFRLYVIEGVSAAETASRLNMTTGHVYVTRSEILRRIRERIGGLAEGAGH